MLMSNKLNNLKKFSSPLKNICHMLYRQLICCTWNYNEEANRDICDADVDGDGVLNDNLYEYPFADRVMADLAETVTQWVLDAQ